VVVALALAVGFAVPAASQARSRGITAHNVGGWDHVERSTVGHGRKHRRHRHRGHHRGHSVVTNHVGRHGRNSRHGRH
jgi:hypothetical protein